MNKQEAIERIEKLDEHYGISQGVYLKKRDVVSIISQIDEPQKVVVPKFVAEWIENHKGNYNKWDKEAKADFVFRSINDLFRFGDGFSPWDFTIDEKFSEWTTKNAYEFIIAILLEYTVEQEKLYTVEIPNPNGVVVCLERLDGGKIALSTLGESELTESEIKKDFDFLWQFAKEVDND